MLTVQFKQQFVVVGIARPLDTLALLKGIKVLRDSLNNLELSLCHLRHMSQHRDASLLNLVRINTVGFLEAKEDGILKYNQVLLRHITSLCDGAYGLGSEGLPSHTRQGDVSDAVKHNRRSKLHLLTQGFDNRRFELSLDFFDCLFREGLRTLLALRHGIPLVEFLGNHRLQHLFRDEPRVINYALSVL